MQITKIRKKMDMKDDINKIKNKKMKVMIKKKIIGREVYEIM